MKSLCCDWLGSADTVHLPVQVAAAPAVSDLHPHALSAPNALTTRTAHALPTETHPETAAENPPNGQLHLHFFCLHLSVSLSPPVSFSTSACLFLSPPACLCLHLSASLTPSLPPASPFSISTPLFLFLPISLSVPTICLYFHLSLLLPPFYLCLHLSFSVPLLHLYILSLGWMFSCRVSDVLTFSLTLWL